ncbi:hypothetical protein GCM10022403_017050 [Streptomyces coacervatus]|uniref:Uncharacterized protein n=1 Tax=Streptomyces coacervatus TaxID=647381 RepID=A0ABP7H6M0_9ACTN
MWKRPDVADLPPVHEVTAVEDRDAGEVLEAGADQVVVLADPAHARVGMEAADDGVSVRPHVRQPFAGWSKHSVPMTNITERTVRGCMGGDKAAKPGARTARAPRHGPADVRV